MTGSSARIDLLEAITGPVSRETYEALWAFEALFRKWNSVTNLASPTTLARFWERHVLDSAQVRALKRDAKDWLDIGSGGGLPGLVTGILLRETVGGSIDLVESNRKKSSFLITSAKATGAPARVHAVRIEDAVIHVKQPQVVTARALAPLPLLLDLASPWIFEGAIGLFHKGRGYRDEISDSHHQWSYDLIEHPSKIDPESVILEISNLRGLNHQMERRPDTEPT